MLIKVYTAVQIPFSAVDRCSERPSLCSIWRRYIRYRYPCLQLLIFVSACFGEFYHSRPNDSIRHCRTRWWPGVHLFWNGCTFCIVSSSLPSAKNPPVLRSYPMWMSRQAIVYSHIHIFLCQPMFMVVWNIAFPKRFDTILFFCCLLWHNNQFFTWVRDKLIRK